MTYESQKEDQSKFKAPNEFKAGSKWKPFKEGAVAYFNSIWGWHNIPLAYVMCEADTSNPIMGYEAERQHLIMMTPH